MCVVVGRESMASKSVLKFLVRLFGMYFFFFLIGSFSIELQNTYE